MLRNNSRGSLRSLEISDPRGFKMYFQNEVPQGGISHGTMMANLALADDYKALGKNIISMSEKELPGGANMATEFFARLEDYTEEVIPAESIHSILVAIFDVGDWVWCKEKSQSKTVFFGGYTYVMRVIDQLVQRLDEPRKFSAYREGFSVGRSLATICREARALEGQHGRSKVGKAIAEEARYLTDEHESQIKEIVLGRIRVAAEDGSLLDSRSPSPLYCWKEMAGLEEPKNWLVDIIRDDQKLAEALETFLSYSWGGFDGEKKEPHLGPKQVRPFLVPSEIINRVRAISDADWLTATQRDAINEFIREYDVAEQRANDTDSQVSVDP